MKDGSPLGRDAPTVGDLPPGAAADEEDQVGLGHQPIGAVAGIGTHHPDRQGGVFRKGPLGVERGRHRDGEPFRQLPHFGLGSRKGDASAGNDDRPPASTQQLGRPLYTVGLRSRTDGRISSELGLEDRVQIGLPLDGLTEVSADLQVNRSRTSGGGLPEGLAEQVGQPLG